VFQVTMVMWYAVAGQHTLYVDLARAHVRDSLVRAHACKYKLN
jgi:hypothetical protein